MSYSNRLYQCLGFREEKYQWVTTENALKSAYDGYCCKYRILYAEFFHYWCEKKWSKMMNWVFALGGRYLRLQRTWQANVFDLPHSMSRQSGWLQEPVLDFFAPFKTTLNRGFSNGHLFGFGKQSLQVHARMRVDRVHRVIGGPLSDKMLIFTKKVSKALTVQETTAWLYRCGSFGFTYIGNAEVVPSVGRNMPFKVDH